MSLTQYDEYGKALNVLTFMSQGHTLSKACAICDLTPHRLKKLAADNDEIARALDDAAQQSHDVMAEALLSIDNHEIYGRTEPRMAKIMSDNIKWFLSKKDTERFGNTVAVNVNLSADRRIVDALNAARQRSGMLAGPVVEAVVEDVDRELSEEEEAELQALLG